MASVQSLQVTVPSKNGPAESGVAGSAPSPPRETPLLSVIVPVFNEERTIGEVIDRVLAAPYEIEVLVVDDGSTDGTAKVLEKWQGHPRVEFLRHSENCGKGTAIRTGLKQARGRFTIIQDGDLECYPEDYPAVVEPLLGGDAEVVYGSRYLRGADEPRQPWTVLRLGVSILNLCVRFFYGARLTDEATCYKAFPTEMLRTMDLQCERFEFCPEVTAKACRLGVKILEVPIRYDARTWQAGKKIRWTDGLEALRTLWRWRNWRPREAEATERVMLSGFLGRSGSRRSVTVFDEAHASRGRQHVKAGD